MKLSSDCGSMCEDPKTYLEDPVPATLTPVPPCRTPKIACKIVNLSAPPWRPCRLAEARQQQTACQAAQLTSD